MGIPIVLSIKPEWVRLILSGEKTLELRRRRPRQDTPFKVYIYESFGDSNNGRKKVVGEFICDHIKRDINPSLGKVDVMDAERSCIDPKDIIAYASRGKKRPKLVFWWNITELKEYDEPKELSEFGLNAAPQSWAFVRSNDGYKEM